MTSLASVNGPSIVDSLPPRRRTRTPSEVGRSPAVSINTPAWVISSISLPISAISRSVGALAVTKSIRIIERNRMGSCLLVVVGVARGRRSLRRSEPAPDPTTNEGQPIRQGRRTLPADLENYLDPVLFLFSGLVMLSSRHDTRRIRATQAAAGGGAACRRLPPGGGLPSPDPGPGARLGYHGRI